jgi:archaeal type IV pilus assembly protein PilA
MNFKKFSKQKKKAISPVLATVILIAITLIAAIAIAGFVFGLFGSFTNSAQVQASVVSCSSAVNVICNLHLINIGTANASATGTCSETYGGVTHAGTTAATVITAGAGAISLTCTPTVAVAGVSGTQVVGSVLLSNGASVTFTGTET